jgi:hypothetical protein
LKNFKSKKWPSSALSLVINKLCILRPLPRDIYALFGQIKYGLANYI